MRKEFKITSEITNKSIAFFDSGVGGLTVYSKLRALLPNENYIYFGDTKHMPYGEKSEAELLQYADNIINFFKKNNIKAVVMACNTTSSVIYEKIKDKYGVKIYPIIQSTAKILSELPIERLGVFATPATIKSDVYKKEIQKHNPNMEVIQIACPEWVRIVEENRINQPQSIEQIKDKLNEMLEFSPEKIVLGCTHYPYLIPALTRFTANSMFIDPAEYFAEYIKNDLTKNNLINTTGKSEQIFVSASPENFVQSAKMFYELKNEPELVLFD